MLRKLLLVLLGSGLLACGEAPVEAQSADVVAAGSIGRLFGKLVGKMKEIVAAEPLSLPSEPDADWMPTLHPLGSQTEAAFDGALIGTRPGDPLATEGCVYLTEPGYFAPQATLDSLTQYAVHDGTAEPKDEELMFYVNGVLTDPDAHCETLRHYAREAKGKGIVGVFNASTLGGAGDFIQAGLDRFTVQIEGAFESWGIDTLANVHKNKTASALAHVIVQRMSARKPMHIMAHSQGGAIASVATHKAIPRLVENGVLAKTEDGMYRILESAWPAEIRIVSMGSAAPKWPPIVDKSLQDVMRGDTTFKHAVHIRDLTPAAMGVNAWNWSADGGSRSGAEFGIVFFDSSSFDGAWQTMHYTSVDFRAMEAGVEIWFYDHPNGSFESEAAEAEIMVPPVEFTDLRPTEYHSVLDYVSAVVNPPPYNGPGCYPVDPYDDNSPIECDEGCFFDEEQGGAVCKPRW